MSIPARLHSVLGLALISLASAALAQGAAPAREGTVVLMPAQAQLQIANDEAVLNFFVEVQDTEAARAQAIAAQKVAAATVALKRADQQAVLESSGYSAYPVYSQAKDQPPRQIAWRVRQGLSLRTTNLDGLGRTAEAGQAGMVLGNVQFRLSRAARQKAEAELIGLAITNVKARIAAAAQALGVPPAGVTIEELSFAPRAEAGPFPVFAARAPAAAEAVAAPQLEAGQSIETLGVSARVRLQP